ncbi:MAG: shikimate dehydrogenase, partial [Bacteroidota bacterium]
ELKAKEAVYLYALTPQNKASHLIEESKSSFTENEYRMKKFGLIGYPLKNSFSENYFNSKFLSHALMDHEYQNFPIEHIEQLKNILNEEPYLFGFNVTIPHKETIIPFLDELDNSAKEVGAVNCVKKTGNTLIGYNTDVYGFEMSLLPLIEHKNVQQALILGTGGASKAVAYVLKKNGIEYTYVSRNPTAEQLSYSALTPELIKTHTLIVNATPLGMFPNIHDAPPVPYEHITSNHIAYDLIYLPIETEFLNRCKQQGATTKNGLEMLHLQAEKSWEIWRENRR